MGATNKLRAKDWLISYRRHRFCFAHFTPSIFPSAQSLIHGVNRGGTGCSLPVGWSWSRHPFCVDGLYGDTERRTTIRNRREPHPFPVAPRPPTRCILSPPTSGSLSASKTPIHLLHPPHSLAPLRGERAGGEGRSSLADRWPRSGSETESNPELSGTGTGKRPSPRPSPRLRLIFTHNWSCWTPGATRHGDHASSGQHKASA
jgi:hypothetical protein